ncbi:hypothetical protein [Sulfobacillus thermosulfidooxidans]|uniref:hypothetical protein n=1 Tax=Sulfobacillus thermosulfidooxidans TaxID=28034 RepID=UPI0006B4A466|nr:hypothetical protein [Sulfobacillus thermosulfidooxidans]
MSHSANPSVPSPVCPQTTTPCPLWHTVHNAAATIGQRVADRLGPCEADILYDPIEFGDDDGKRSYAEMAQTIQRIVQEEILRVLS